MFIIILAAEGSSISKKYNLLFSRKGRQLSYGCILSVDTLTSTARTHSFSFTGNFNMYKETTVRDTEDIPGIRISRKGMRSNKHADDNIVFTVDTERDL